MQTWEETFDTLYTRYAALIHSYVRGIVGIDDAEDVAQVTWLKVYRALSQGKSDVTTGNTAAWLMRVARNAAYDWLRGVKRTQGRNDSLSEAHDLLIAPEDAHDDGRLRCVLSAVRPQERAALLMVGLDYSYAEIAQRLQISESSIKMRLYRARQTARKALEQEEAVV